MNSLLLRLRKQKGLDKSKQLQQCFRRSLIRTLSMTKMQSVDVGYGTKKSKVSQSQFINLFFVKRCDTSLRERPKTSHTQIPSTLTTKKVLKLSDSMQAQPTSEQWTASTTPKRT